MAYCLNIENVFSNICVALYKLRYIYIGGYTVHKKISTYCLLKDDRESVRDE